MTKHDFMNNIFSFTSHLSPFNYENGLSQKDRINRVGNAKKIHVIDNSVESILHQAEIIAAFLKYCNFSNKPDGYFDQFLSDLHEIRLKGFTNFVPDGTLEPSQALLLVFIKQLHKIGEHFNQRFKDYVEWYIHHFLNLKPLSPGRHKVCLAFQKNTNDSVIIEKGTGFALKENKNKTFVYRILEDTCIDNVLIENILALYFCKQKNIYPASYLNFVTSLRVKDLKNNDTKEGILFSTEEKSKHVRELGFMVTSPSLLLREGKRHVKVELAFENVTFKELKSKFVNALKIFRKCKEKGFDIQKLLSEFKRGLNDNQRISEELSGNDIAMQSILIDLQRDILFQKILSELDISTIPETEISTETIGNLFIQNLFLLNISTSQGWEIIENYSIKAENNHFTIEFSLDEDFPATSPCEDNIHKFSSKHPALRFILNLDARLYSYSWMKYVLLKKIHIETEVSDISNILVYNDLGRIDNSKPFSPFGINTEKGTWFTIGNYEMALKNTLSVDLKIEWGQLPCNNEGLYGYYKLYDQNIDNTSFKVDSRYLSDYHWKNDKTLYLFSTEPRQQNHVPYSDIPLSNISRLKNISVEKMPPIQVEEENYEYTIHAQSGFISFVLTSPEMGLGDKHYRNIFTDYIIQNTSKKKKKTLAPNPPLNPQIERLTMSYKASDVIDLRKKNRECCNSAFYHITSFGNYLLYPSNEINEIPLIYSMETDANILIQLSGVKKGGKINLYFDFFPLNKEISLNEVPSIKWYLGNGYQWEEIPHGYVMEDKTRNLLASGIVKIHIPENVCSSLYVDEQKIWLRVGIEQHDNVISYLKNVYVNVAEAELKIDNGILKSDESLTFTGQLELEKKIPGIEDFKIISFYGGRQKETPREMLIRFSEYASHRGKAVTPRDIERITLQEFPDMGKVKCFPNYNCKSDEKGVVTLVVIPEITPDNKTEPFKPMANSRQILKIEHLLKKRTSAYLTKIDVINPLYEEITVRCKVKFNQKISTAACRAKLQTICNRMIAPWQPQYRLPDFDYCIEPGKLHQLIREMDFVSEVSELSIIRIAQKNKNQYEIHEYQDGNEIVKPSKPYSIFIPAKEHIILNVDSEIKLSEQFGINEMLINESFIVES